MLVRFKAVSKTKTEAEIDTVETVKMIQTINISKLSIKTIVKEEKQTIIPEANSVIQHQHSNNLKWHKHDLNIRLKMEEPCTYCGVPSSGIYKINTLPICLNCYIEICNICNGMYNAVLEQTCVYTLQVPQR